MNLALECHHRKPRNEGGKSLEVNGDAACPGCHDLPTWGTVIVGGGTPEARTFSDKDLKPLVRNLAAESTCLELEVEKPVNVDRPLPEPPLTLATIPNPMPRAWWLSHRHLFEWSEKAKAFVFHPERQTVDQEQGAQEVKA